MKIENDLELIKKIENHEPVHIIYDGDDFGIYEYKEKNKRYEGIIGFLETKTLIQAIRDKNYFIKVF